MHLAKGVEEEIVGLHLNDDAELVEVEVVGPVLVSFAKRARCDLLLCFVLEREYAGHVTTALHFDAAVFQAFQDEISCRCLLAGETVDVFMHLNIEAHLAYEPVVVLASRASEHRNVQVRWEECLAFGALSLLFVEEGVHEVEDLVGDRLDPLSVNERPPTKLLLNEVLCLAEGIRHCDIVGAVLLECGFV